MPLAATCPRCRTAHRLADDLDGRLIRCKECREPFRVGGDRPDEDDEQRPRRRQARSSSPALIPLLVVGGVLGAAVLIGGGAAVWWFMRTQPVPGIHGGGTVRRSSPNAVIPDHTIFPPRPAGHLNRPAELPEGPEAVTLANPRRVEGLAPNRPTYQVDYQLVVGPPQRGAEWYYLVVKVPAGIGETHLRLPDGRTQGIIAFSFFPGHDPGRGFELWVEREPFGKPKERVRVSKTVALN